MAFGPDVPKLQAHLCVSNAHDAIAFYQEAFSGRCTFKQLADDRTRVLHANLEVFGSEIMLHDEFPELKGDCLSPLSRGGASVTLAVNLPEPSDVDSAVEAASRAGADITLAPDDQFWGARYGRIRDPFGHVWAFNAPIQNSKTT